MNAAVEVEEASRPKKRLAERSGDYLEPITSKVKAKNFVVYDIESKKDDTDEAGFTRPFLVGLYDPARDRYREFRDEPHLKPRAWARRHLDPGGCIDKLMVTFLQPKYKGYVAYAHNAGSFDALFVLTWLQEHRDDYAFEVVPVQSSIQAIRIWRAPEDPDDPITERWEMLDSMKLLPMGLAKACTALGVPGKLSHDLNMHEDDPRWSAYLEQDCRALGAVMLRFYDLVENRLGGEVGMTTPSTAMKLFRRRFLGQDGVQERISRYRHFPGCDKPESCDGCLHDWVRLGYYGGRTEIFHFYGEDLRYFDFNSSYAASMLELMPIGDMVVEEGRLDMRRHKSKGGRYGGFCECTVYVPPECPIPPLPHRDKKTGKLTFPTGQFHGVWSADELALLEDPLVGGEVRHVVRTVWYGLRPLFAGFVRTLWELRDKTRPGYDEGLSLLAKLILNALYGKFGMKKERTMVVFRHDEDETGGVRCFLCMEPLPCLEGEPTQGICSGCEGSKPADPSAEGEVWYQRQKTDVAYMIPQISASITADARVRLWKSMKDVISSDASEQMKASVTWKVVAWCADEEGHLDEVETYRERFDMREEAKRFADQKQKKMGDSWRFRVEKEEIIAGDVVILDGAPHVVIRKTETKKRVTLTLRGADDQGRSEITEVTFAADLMVRMAGRIYYLDTDSLITNVKLPSSSALGAMKDEYDGETLTYLGLQAKAYLIDRTSRNKSVREILLASELEPDEEGQHVRWDSTEAKLPAKVTLKGFPPALRKEENLKALRGGKVLEWDRLEKVRSLAQKGFSRSPQMQPVKKSFHRGADGHPIYDKRVRVGNGTRAIVLSEPLGGFIEDIR